MATKRKIEIELFQSWKEKVLAKVNEKKVKSRGAKSVCTDY